MAIPGDYSRYTSYVIRVTLVVALLLGVLGTASATDIESEEQIIRLGEQTDVTINLNYSELTSEQISVLVPASHTPRQLRGYDADGSIDCEYSDVDDQILCEPGDFNTTYDVTIEYTTPTDYTTLNEYTRPDAQGENGYLEFTHPKNILVPTNRYTLRVILPEGYGLVEDTEVQPLDPPGAQRGSDAGGRQFTVTWEETDLSLGETLTYDLRYQELRVFEDLLPDHLSFIAAFILILASFGIYLYVKRRQKEEETIAAIMPVLKDDEKEALQYIIEHEGDCEQKDLVDNLDYSKAKVSRLVKDLEERNLIDKIKEGRKNRLVLAKEIGNIESDD